MGIPSESPSSGARKQILYVDNHDDSRQMMMIILELSGYEVVSASTVTEALRLTRLKRYDLYLLEVRFPDGTGFELCRQLRLLHPQTPILFYSAAAFSYDIQAGFEAGAQHYLTKPMDLYVIEEVMAKILVSSGEECAYIQNRTSGGGQAFSGLSRATGMSGVQVNGARQDCIGTPS